MHQSPSDTAPSGDEPVHQKSIDELRKERQTRRGITVPAENERKRNGR